MPNIDTIDWFKGLEISSGGLYPLHRQQVSRTAGGTAQVRDLGEQLWTAEFTTVPMLLDDAYDLETELLDLGGSLHWVYIFDPRRAAPKEWDGSASLSGYSYTSIDSSDRHIVNLAVGTTSLSKGDYFHFTESGTRYLHRVTEMISSTQARVWPAMSLNSPTFAVIDVQEPAARFQIDPDSVNNRVLTIDENTKHARVSFRGVQTLK